MKPRICDTGLICERCRDVARGRIMRAGVRTMLVSRGELPPEAPEQFECPYAIAWGSKSEVKRGTKPKCPNCGGEHPLRRCPIPLDTSPEKERLRAQQGGCCG